MRRGTTKVLRSEYLNIKAVTDLPVDHVRDHHDLVGFCVGELQRQFGGLDVKRQDDRIL